MQIFLYKNYNAFNNLLMAMTNSRIILQNEGDHVGVKIIGDISAATEFPQIYLRPDQTSIILLFAEAGYVNSSGVQSWISWLSSVQKLNPRARFFIQMLPSNYARLAHYIKDFFPLQTTLESFVAPYFCEKCSRSFNITFEKGLNWNEKWTSEEKIQKITLAKCSECNSLSEIDTMVEAYEKF